MSIYKFGDYFFSNDRLCFPMQERYFGSLSSVAMLVNQRLNERRWHVFGEAGSRVSSSL